MFFDYNTKMNISSSFSKKDLFPVILLLSLYFTTPLMPKSAIDPWGLLNPQKFLSILFAIGLIQVISVFTQRILGSKTGVLLASFLSGFISSTAIFLHVLQDAKKTTQINRTLIASALSATVGSILELLFLLYISSHQLFLEVYMPLSALTLVIFICILLFVSLKKNSTPHTANLEFNFKSYISLCFIFAGLLLIVKLSQQLLGNQGTTVLSFIAGIFELHAMSLANANLLEQSGIDLVSARFNIILATSASLASKVGLSLLISRNKTGFAIATVYFILAILASLIL